MEEIGVVVGGDGGVSCVVAVGAKGVGGGVALGQRRGGGLPAVVAGVGVCVVGNVARGQGGEERVDAGVAGEVGV